MQKASSFFLVALFITLISAVHAQTVPDNINYKLKVGDVLTYEINQHSKKQSLKMQFTAVPDSYFDFAKLTFNWTKTGVNINQSGKVKFTGHYLDDYNLSVSSSFRVDFDQLNQSEIFPSQGIWLGTKAQMDMLLSGEEFGISLLDDEEETTYQLENKIYYQTATLNGKACSIKIANYQSAVNGENFMMIQDEDANPLIINVYIKEKNFSMKLISIEEGKNNALTILSEPTLSNSTSLPSVIIGTQTWTTQNLDVSKFRNGDIIPEAKSGAEWVKYSEQRIPAWRYYDDESGAKYGKLYNWFAAADPRGLAPEGWHIPSEAEWAQLINYLGGERYAGSIMKTREGWETNNGTNENGFSALPGGYVFNGWGGLCFDLGKSAYFWSSTETGVDRAWIVYIIDYETWAALRDFTKVEGISVRCIEN